MVDGNGLKKVLQEPNALGWIAFLILVLSIGIGTVIFDHGEKPVREKAAQTANSGSNYLK